MSRSERSSSRTTLVVMVYDVVGDRRRDKLHSLLSKWGVAIQKSAFEARLTPADKVARLEALQAAGLKNQVDMVVDDGHHNWYTADRFAMSILERALRM